MAELVIVLSQHHLLSQSCGSGSSLAGSPQCPHAGQFVLSPKEQHELLALPHPAASHCSGIWLHPLAEAMPQLLALGEAGTDSRTTRSSQDLGQEAGNEMQEQEFLCESSWEQSAPGIGWRHPSLTPRMAVGVCRTCAAPGTLPQAAGAKAGWAAEPAVASECSKALSKGGTLEDPCQGTAPPCPALADATYITQVTAWYWGQQQTLIQGCLSASSSASGSSCRNAAAASL